MGKGKPDGEKAAQERNKRGKEKRSRKLQLRTKKKRSGTKGENVPKGGLGKATEDKHIKKKDKWGRHTSKTMAGSEIPKLTSFKEAPIKKKQETRREKERIPRFQYKQEKEPS